MHPVHPVHLQFVHDTEQKIVKTKHCDEQKRGEIS